MRYLSWSIKIILVLLVLALLLALIWVVVNWRDVPPSATAIEFQQAWDNRAPVKDSENAYLYMLGFDAAADENPQELGVKRFEWLETHYKSYQSEQSDFPDQGITAQDFSSAAMAQIDKQCKRDIDKCIYELKNTSSVAASFSGNEKIILDRYFQLISFRSYKEELWGVAAPLLDYELVLRGQRLMMMAMFLRPKIQAEEISRQLNQDQAFWRMMLKNSDFLLTKMIAVAAVKNNFLWANRISANRSSGESVHLVPPLLFEALSSDELSIRRILVGEWIFGQITQDQLDSQVLKSSVIERIKKFLFFKRQDFANCQAEQLDKFSGPSEVSIDDFEGVYEQINRDQDADLANVSGGWLFVFSTPYNPVGRALVRVAEQVYTPYLARTYDLEVFRRGVIASLRLLENPDTTITEFELQSPYKSKPWELQAASRLLVVTGLSNPPKSQQSYIFKRAADSPKGSIVD